MNPKPIREVVEEFERMIGKDTLDKYLQLDEDRRKRIIELRKHYESAVKYLTRRRAKQEEYDRIAEEHKADVDRIQLEFQEAVKKLVQGS